MYKDKIQYLKENTDLTNRQIAEQLGCSRRTVRRYAGPQRFRVQSVKEQKLLPKILVFDIETAPMEVFVWRLGKNVIDHSNVVKDWCILSWAAKWLFDDAIMSMKISGEDAIKRDDSSILKQLWHLLNEADIIVAHNANGFDVPRLNARFINAYFVPPSPFRVIDTYREVKKISWPSSYSLDYLTHFLDLREKKTKVGFDLWVRSVNGDDSALEEMLRYNEQDVFALEELYLVLRPWIRSHPAIGLYLESDEPVCPACASSDLIWKGFYYTPAGKYESFRCSDCGAIGRSRYNAYDKNKRKTLCISTAR